MNFTYNNHLTFSIGGRQFGRRETPYDAYTVAIGSIDADYYKTSNWLQEQYRTAECVVKDLGHDFVVMFSGGTDSEIVLRILKKMGIKHRTVFIKLSDDNLIDLFWAQKITHDLEIPLEIVDIDVIDFFKSGHACEIAVDVQCSSPAYLPIYKYLLENNAPAVLGGELLLIRDIGTESTKWFLGFDEELNSSVSRFSLQNNIPIVVDWFSYTPEMIGYWLEHPDIQELVSNRYNYKLSSTSSKNKILKSLVPDIISRVKRTGYEQLPGFRYEVSHMIKKLMPIKYDRGVGGIYLSTALEQLYKGTHD